jgi:hypothetical protein
MNNTSEAIAASVKSSHDHVTPKKAFVTASNHFITYLGVGTIVACFTIWFAASAAHAQDSLGQQAARASTGITTGWWSPETTATAPQITLAAADLSRFRASGLHQTSTQISSPVNNALQPSGSFFSPSQTKYIQPQSLLADTRPLINVNGTLVRPLAQVSYAGWSLPVVLRTSPLAGSDGRW